MKYYFRHNFWIILTLIAGLAANSRAGSVWQFVYGGYESASDPTALRESVSTLTNSETDPYFPDSLETAFQLDDWFVYAGQPPLFGLQGRYNSGTDYGTWIFGLLKLP